MYRRHVYGDPGHVTPELIRTKQQVARRPGAQFAAAAFVTGALDPVGSREAFARLAQTAAAPLLTVIGNETPARSLAEMEALIESAPTEVSRLPGALGLYEEYPAALANLVAPFFKRHVE